MRIQKVNRAVRRMIDESRGANIALIDLAILEDNVHRNEIPDEGEDRDEIASVEQMGL